MSDTLGMPVEAVATPLPLTLTGRLREFALYFAASVAGLVTDAVTLVLLVSVLGLGHLPAATIAFLSGSVAVYLLSVRFAFDYRRVRDTRFEFALFALLGLSGLGVTLLVMYVGVDLLHADYRLAKFAAAGASFAANYATRKILLFTAQ